jgi:hypothetical protein
VLRQYRTRRRPLCTCVSCFNYRKCILLIIFYIHFPCCHTCYSASNERNSPRFRIRTEELCSSHAIEVNVNFITIIEVLPRIWFRTARVLHFDDSMLIYVLFSRTLVGTRCVVRLWWCQTGAIPVLRRCGTRRRPLCTCVSCFNYRKYTSYNFLYSLPMVSHILFCIKRKKQPSIQGSHRGVMPIPRDRGQCELYHHHRSFASDLVQKCSSAPRRWFDVDLHLVL